MRRSRRRGADAGATDLQPDHDFYPRKGNDMRSVLLWMLGVPIPIIILIALFAR